MQPVPLISIVIVYWNSAKYLPRCLDCLSLQTFKDFEIILIDNGSLDGGTNEIVEKNSKLNLLLEPLTSNIGFAAANNIGARLARGKWLALLNTDAFPEPDWLEKLISASKAYPEFVSFSSRQLQANNPELLDGAGDVYHVSGLAWKRNMGYPAVLYGLEPKEVFSPCAAAAIYKRDTFLEVGGFDEDFFSYFEDVDLGFRLRLRGYRCLYIPDAIVYHVGSSTFGLKSNFAFYHSHRNLIWIFIKNMPTSIFWRYLPAHLILNLIYLAYYTLLGRGRVLWQAKWDAIKELSKVLNKRQKIQNSIKVKSSDLTRAMERGWLTPYLLRYNLQKAKRKVSL